MGSDCSSSWSLHTCHYTLSSVWSFGRTETLSFEAGRFQHLSQDQVGVGVIEKHVSKVVKDLSNFTLFLHASDTIETGLDRTWLILPLFLNSILLRVSESNKCKCVKHF